MLARMTLASSRHGVLTHHYMLSRMTQASSRHGVSTHHYMLARMTLASSRHGVSTHHYMLARMTLASSRHGVSTHHYMLSRMTLASSRHSVSTHHYMLSRMTQASSLWGGGDRQTPSSRPLWPEPGWAFCSPIWAFPSMPTLFTLCVGGLAIWPRTGGLCHRHTAGLRRVEKPGACMLPPS